MISNSGGNASTSAASQQEEKGDSSGLTPQLVDGAFSCFPGSNSSLFSPDAKSSYLPDIEDSLDSKNKYLIKSIYEAYKASFEVNSIVFYSNFLYSTNNTCFLSVVFVFE